MVTRAITHMKHSLFIHPFLNVANICDRLQENRAQRGVCKYREKIDCARFSYRRSHMVYTYIHTHICNIHKFSNQQPFTANVLDTQDKADIVIQASRILLER